MSFVKRTARLINRSLSFAGVEVIPASRSMDSISRLRNMRRLGFDPKVILDGGAFRGNWARDVAHLFSKAHMIMVEPNPNLEPAIRANTVSIKDRVKLFPVALGERPSTMTLNIWSDREFDAGASLLPHVTGDPLLKLEVQVRTIDDICSDADAIPNLLKLDLQGAELAALKGAEQALKQVEAAIIEFGVFQAYVDRTTPRELLDFMYDRDFSLYDVLDLYRRPHDGALAGGDFVFVKNTSPLRSYQGWSQT